MTRNKTSHPTPTDLLALCAALADAGIWLTLTDAGALVCGPTHAVDAHPELLYALRHRKAAMTRLLEDCVAHSLYGDQADDPRFERDICPECHQACLVVLSPRRLGVHRLPDRRAVCPGSDRAQAATAETIMVAFIADRCLPRAGAALTWYSLRGALEAWCVARTFFLPPRPFLVAWMDAHYQRVGEDERPMWAGLTLQLLEWGIADETPEPGALHTPGRQALRLKA